MVFEGKVMNYYDSVNVNRALTSCAKYNDSWRFTMYWGITSNDVIHNWRIRGVYPRSYGMKMDAYPRRINLAGVDACTQDKFFH